MGTGRSAEISKSLVKRRWSESDARAVVSAWRRSGKRISEFAIENGLSAKRVYRWSARRCCTALAESEIRLWWWPRYVRA